MHNTISPSSAASPVSDLPQWASGPGQPFLPPGELHIWRARLGEEAFPGCPVAREAGRLAGTQHFQREVASRYTGLAAADTCGLNISLAECDGVALLAISRAVREVGLDLERVRDDIPFEEMAESFLDVRAQWDLRVTWSRQEKAWKFFQFWTSNEACSQVRTISAHAEARTFQIRRFSPGQDFVAALALHGGPAPEIHFWDWLA